MTLEKVLDRIGLVLQLLGSAVIIIKVAGKLDPRWDQPWVLLVSIIFMFSGRMISGLIVYIKNLLGNE